MTGLEPVAGAVLTKAIDFLFDQAGKLMEERRENRKKAGEPEDTPQPPAGARPATKDEMASKPKPVVLKDVNQELEHCLTMIEMYRRNKRNIEVAIAAYGGFTLAPRINQNELLDTENNIKQWSQKLKNLVEQVYGQKIMLIGLD